MMVIAELLGIVILLIGAYYGGVAIIYRWMNGPNQKVRKGK